MTNDARTRRRLSEMQSNRFLNRPISFQTHKNRSLKICHEKLQQSRIENGLIRRFDRDRHRGFFEIETNDTTCKKVCLQLVPVVERTVGFHVVSGQKSVLFDVDVSVGIENQARSIVHVSILDRTTRLSQFHFF